MSLSPWIEDFAKSFMLDELLRKVTDDNISGAWDTGPAAGKEVW
jgi:hypothetical protein